MLVLVELDEFLLVRDTAGFGLEAICEYRFELGLNEVEGAIVRREADAIGVCNRVFYVVEMSGRVAAEECAFVLWGSQAKTVTSYLLAGILHIGREEQIKNGLLRYDMI